MSTSDDYRYPCDSDTPEVIACHVPDELARRCRQLGRQLQLPFVGIDLRLIPSGEWYCFEANPSPAFTYYEHATGQAIAESLARLLT